VQVWANDWLKKENAMVSNRKLVDANSRVVQKFLKVTREDKNTVLMKMLKKEVDEAKEENREFLIMVNGLPEKWAEYQCHI
jgi:hypothetical protein